MLRINGEKRESTMTKPDKTEKKGYIFPKKTESRAAFFGKSVSRAGIIGLHPLSGLLVGGVAGYFLWKYFAAPWIFWCMLAFGFIAGCRNAYRDFRAMQREEEAEDAAKKPQRT
ncbi:MAG: hypothetical protein DELT_01781 [Desulfovibrio sp.]